MPKQGQSTHSTVFIYVNVSVLNDSDLTGDPVVVAFPDTGINPYDAGSTWWPATILPGNIVAILNGPFQNDASFPQLAPGKYDMWVDLTDSPERPVEPVGTWTVTT